MAKSAGNLLFRFGDLEIKVKLMPTCEEQKGSQIEIHRKCRAVKASKTVCTKCKAKTEEKDCEDSGKGKVDQVTTTEQAPALSTATKPPLKAVYCSGDCGCVLEGDAVENVAWCNNCDCALAEKDIVIEFKTKEHQVKLFKKELRALEKMRLDREIQVLEVLKNHERPPNIFLGQTYQLVPGKNAECSFLTLLTAMKRERNLVLLVELKINKEYCGVVAWDSDKQAILLTLLHPEREISVVDVEFGNFKPQAENVDLMRQVLRGGVREFDHCQQLDGFDTAYNHSFWSLVMAKIVGGAYTVPSPVRLKEQQVALTKQLAQSLDTQEEETKARVNAAKKAEVAKRRAAKKKVAKKKAKKKGTKKKKAATK